MRIAINTRFLLPNKMEGFGWYTFETVSRIVANHPEHEFIFFFDRKYDAKFVFAKNVTPIILNPPARHPILFKIWFNFSVTKALRKYKCDAFISPDGYLSLKTNIPQLAVIHDLNFEHNPEDLPKSARNYLRAYFPKFAKKANFIHTVSLFSKQDIAKTYNIPLNKIDYAHNGASSVFKPIPQQEILEHRLKYTRGEEYILFVGALHPRKNLNRLLTAFEQLKRNKNISQKLLIVGESLWDNDKFKVSEEIKNDVLFTGHVSQIELAKIIGAAYIFAFVPYFEGFGIPLLEAMKCGVPCLSGNLTSLPEVGGDAVLYCNPLNENDIASKLFELISDKKLRQSLSEKSIKQASKFSWDKAADGLWNSFLKMLS